MKISYQSDSTIFKLIEKKDALNPYDGLSLSAFNKAKALGKKLIDSIPSEPAMCEDCVPGMNYFMATALHYYASHELDSIAISEYKKHVKEGNYYIHKSYKKNKRK